MWLASNQVVGGSNPSGRANNSLKFNYFGSISATSAAVFVAVVPQSLPRCARLALSSRRTTELWRGEHQSAGKRRQACLPARPQSAGPATPHEPGHSQHAAWPSDGPSWSAAHARATPAMHVLRPRRHLRRLSVRSCGRRWRARMPTSSPAARTLPFLTAA